MDGNNVCLIDSIGSQANRIETIFKLKEYSSLVPQIVVKAGEKKVNLLDAGHRAGDAIIRCSELKQELQDAFKDVSKGNAEPLAKIAPTSLVFGVWDSRDTQAKLPRIISSTIRAFNVRKLTRSAQYVPAMEYIKEGLIDEPTDDKTREAYAERGFVHQPATGTHGGVIATGGIRRDAAIHLAALRLLNAGGDKERTFALRRYILGLALTAFTAQPYSYLRQGCNLVRDSEKQPETKLVYSNGSQKSINLSHKEALAYARATAKEFGIGKDREIEFNKQLAKKEIDIAIKESKKKSGRPKEKSQ